MRALVLSIWVFINLVFFGMCGYMYLLWSQYWLELEKQVQPTQFNYDQQIYYYNRGYILNDTSKSHNFTENKRIKHSTKENNSITIIKNSKPRFPNLQNKEFEVDTKEYTCTEKDSTKECDKKILDYKENILKELRRVFTDETNILKAGVESRYNVQYKGNRGNYMNKNSKEILCELKRVTLKTLTKADVHVKWSYLRDHLPKRSLFDGRNSYNSCAIVASAGSLKNSNLGNIIGR